MKNKYGNLIISDRGLAAREDGAVIFSQITKKWFTDMLYDTSYNDVDNWLEIKQELNNLNLREIKKLAEISWTGEWHHSGKYAAEVKYFWFNDMIDYVVEKKDLCLENIRFEVGKDLDNKTNSVEVEGKYAVWTGSKKQPKLEKWEPFKGVLKGDWIYIEGVGKKKQQGTE